VFVLCVRAIGVGPSIWSLIVRVCIEAVWFLGFGKVMLSIATHTWYGYPQDILSGNPVPHPTSRTAQFTSIFPYSMIFDNQTSTGLDLTLS